MGKLSAKVIFKIDYSSPKCIKEKREDKIEIIMIDTDQTVEIDTVDCHIELDLRTDKIIEKGLSMFKITKEILEEEILEKQKC